MSYTKQNRFGLDWLTYPIYDIIEVALININVVCCKCDRMQSYNNWMNVTFGLYVNSTCGINGVLDNQINCIFWFSVCNAM